MQVLYEGENEPSFIALDDRYVYWASLEEIRRAPMDGGGAPVTIATGRYIRGLLLAGDYIYYAESASSSGSIRRVARTGGEPEHLAEATAPWSLAISDGALYWSDPGNTIGVGAIMRADLDGSRATALVSNLPWPGDIALDGEFIYFTSTGESCFASPEGSGCLGGGIYRMPKAGGASERVHSTSAAGSIVLSERGLFWPAMSPPRIMFAPLGGSERELANVLEHGIGGLSSDSGALYWGSGDKLLRMSFDDERVSRLATELEGATAVAVRGDWAYTPEAGAGRIVRVAIDGSANRPEGPITGPCPSPLGTPEEIALTPRADENLELLALSLEPGRITASTSTYERVVADIAAVRAVSPDLADVRYFAADDGKTIYLGLTDIAAQSLRAGKYSAWDCLNDAYGFTSITQNDAFGSSYVLIQLHGIYDVGRLATLYAQLPGVSSAGPNSREGDGPTLCAARDGERYEYVVDRAGGDCPAGCTEHEAYLFASDASGQVTALDTWSSESGSPAPEWFGRVCSR